MLVVILALLHLPQGHAQSVWIDTDLACGLSRTTDVDDCWALQRAIQSQAIDVMGVSTVFGNANGDSTFQITRKVVLNLTGEANSIPVYQGGKVKIRNRQTQMTNAVAAIIDQLEKGPLTLVALGPLTNIASVILERPDLLTRINEVLVVAGRREGGSSRFYPGKSALFHLHDFNFRKDVEAFEILLESSVPVTMLPYELATKVQITSAELEKVAQNPDMKWLKRVSLKWLSFWQEALKADGFHPFDSLTIHYLIAPEEFQCETIPAKIVHNRSLFTESRDDLLVSQRYTGNRLVTYCHNLSHDIQLDYTGT